MAEKNTNQGGGSGEGNDSTLTIKLDDGTEKTLGPEDVKNLLAQQGKVTQMEQQFAPMKRILSKYGIDKVEDYLSNAEPALAVVADLMEKGIIDEQGQVKQAGRQSHQASKQSGQRDQAGSRSETDDFDFEGLFNQERSDSASNDRASATIRKALEPIAQKQRELEDGLNALYTARLVDRVHQKYPNTGLEDKDVRRLLSEASSQRKDFWEVIENEVEGRKTQERELRKKHAEEFGIDLESWEKKRQSGEAEKKSLGDWLGERKIAFGQRKKKLGEDKAVTPLEAMREHFTRLQEEGGE